MFKNNIEFPLRFFNYMALEIHSCVFYYFFHVKNRCCENPMVAKKDCLIENLSVKMEWRKLWKLTTNIAQCDKSNEWHCIMKNQHRIHIYVSMQHIQNVYFVYSFYLNRCFSKWITNNFHSLSNNFSHHNRT